MRTVGAYEAKTHLSQLLDEVAGGGSIAITRHEHTVALLVPAGDAARREPRAVIAGLRAFRRGITLGDSDVRSMIEEGRG
jgi:prevent-host-death family protein